VVKAEPEKKEKKAEPEAPVKKANKPATAKKTADGATFTLHTSSPVANLAADFIAIVADKCGVNLNINVA